MWNGMMAGRSPNKVANASSPPAPRARASLMRQPPAPTGKKSSAISETDVVAMEMKLSELKATMAAEREKRDAARRNNPTGASHSAAESSSSIP